MRRARAWMLAALTTVAGCDVCGLISQQVVVPADDPDLAALIADCTGKSVPPTTGACMQDPGLYPKIICRCLPLCQRVYEIVDPDPHRAALEWCSGSVDTKGEAHVYIGYRSQCE
jgi:hypothetical protein